MAADLIELRVGRVAHGGSCVGRHDGQVVFVRHTLPGELVRARITRSRARYLFADAVEILEPSPDRVSPPCPLAGPGRCGGCDWQHASLPRQRALKAEVLKEQLARLGGVTADVEVMAVPGDIAGLEWRTNVRYAVAEDGTPGFHRHHTHEVIAVDRCRIAVREIQAAPVTGRRWDPRRYAKGVEVVRGSDGVHVAPRGGTIPQTAVDRSWVVPAGGFWQSHPGAADALAEHVVAAAVGAEAVWDLYCGVGLFAGALEADDPGRRIEAVESHRGAAAAAVQNCGPGVTVHTEDVRHWVGRPHEDAPDVVVLDPPRKGAGEQVLRAIDATGCPRIVYVACDPSALGRDVGTLRGLGWELESVVGLDLFPMTHHVEAVAVMARAGTGPEH